MAEWLKDAVFYEIYPQSFYDTNGDGIGDFEGIISKLDYINDLGCNAIWMNPCFDSPFKDAGYDVRDYRKAAERYGSNEDLYRLFDEAHKRGMHVILDLVAGHTSEEHEWFKRSCLDEKNEYSDRYIWTDFWLSSAPGHLWIGGECERNGTYMLNFFKCQPALNYGFHEPKAAWQQGMDDPGPTATREAMTDVMRFWLSHGADGFRVDMADSLVKDDDEKKSSTCETWRRMFSVIRKEFPEAAFVSEWGNPGLAIGSAGFDMDFLLDHAGRGYKTLMRDEEGGKDRSYFKKDAGGDIRRFLTDYLKCLEETEGKGYISLISCNHDTPRAKATLTDEELKLAYAFIFTMPGVPFLYYGDEIGMRYIAGLKTKEGGYTRTGTRTPMQWSEGKNKGFSDADVDMLYLPVDASEGAPSVEKQEKDADSLLNTLKAVLRLRHEHKELRAEGGFEVICDGADSPFVYGREGLILAVNPSSKNLAADTGRVLKEKIFSIGSASAEGGRIVMGAGSFAVYRQA